MDRLGVQDKVTMKKKASPKGRNPVKVVYIGDPKKVQASAADFRALVQELTGWNASSMSVSLKPLDLPFAEESPKADVGGAESLPGLLPVDDRFASPPELPISDQASPDHHQSLTEYSDFSIESFNEWILQQMLDVSSGSFQSPSLLYGLSSETCAL